MLRGIQSTSTAYDLSYEPKYVAIAPIRDRENLTLDLEESDAIERRYNYKSPGVQLQAASIARRNARERNRVKQVNDGFNALRKRLPTAIVDALSGGARRGSGKKLSKVDTLRMVVQYIKYLQNLLDPSDAALDLGKSKSTANTDMTMDTTYENDEGIVGGRISPYSESVPSPADSDFSSGVCSNLSSNNEYYSNNYYFNGEMVSIVNEDDLLDAISWWQQK